MGAAGKDSGCNSMRRARWNDWRKVDAPETGYFVREEKRKFEQMGIPYEIHYPKESMWQLIVRHVTPPTRLMRYCCADLKENTGEFGERIVTGVRKAESNNRKKQSRCNYNPKT